jgi:hypothetical protein
MSTRTIVTSQPDVACDVCERRLLRGEQPDVFLDAGRRLIVCELCAPRAAHEGWMREADGESIAAPVLRPRRGRSILERLTTWTRQPVRAAAREGERVSEAAPSSPALDFLQPGPDALEAAAATDGMPSTTVGEPPGDANTEPSYVELAVAGFNASEYPRRVAGVARSLGAPEVSVRSAEHLSSVVVIVVAWELCWYRYEVDLSDGPAEVRVREQGTELSELPHYDRLANALATDAGVLALAAATH